MYSVIFLFQVIEYHVTIHLPLRIKIFISFQSPYYVSSMHKCKMVLYLNFLKIQILKMETSWLNKVSALGEWPPNVMPSLSGEQLWVWGSLFCARNLKYSMTNSILWYTMQKVISECYWCENNVRGTCGSCWITQKSSIWIPCLLCHRGKLT